MKKVLSLVLALLFIASFCASCAPSEPKTDAKATEISVCLASEPDTIDPALNSAVDGATLIAHLFSGLSKWALDNSGKLVIVADAAKELPAGVANADGTITYTYTLRDGLKWSDGQDVKASDFVFAWNRAASAALAADYGYMFDVIKGYDEVSATLFCVAEFVSISDSPLQPVRTIPERHAAINKESIVFFVNITTSPFIF